MSGFLLHLLRHGEPEPAGHLLGHGDWPPTAAGIAACVDRARGLDVAALWASDLSRAALAGDAIGAVAGLPLRTDSRWRELDFGAWDGRAVADIDPAAMARFWDAPDAAPPPGGERWSALVARVSGAIAALPPHPTLVVTHGGAMRAALAALCGFSAAQAWAFDLPYAALLSLRVWPGDRPAAQIVGLRT
ncbi:histidine phosphatase family protein [Sphingobium sp. HBC34]|uniref:Histidine phosphatase family protein n=1 Tax=Sphingobium cyanobacteriorum TaxID=3063954 RepID=A0ABT8ZQF5_9SPHN|nr:histidine phosphatase family protein [Sphingobium sp. HBC34]MDO7836673.1 histidine phosphatase family protein [Sphingobium sp. HBC34]